MQSLLQTWSTLDAGKRVLVFVATAAVFALVLFMARGANTPNYSLLYGGLEPKASADVITALEQQGVIYDVRGSGIYVEAGLRDSLRMSLAGEGLPASGGQGYELLDKLTGFGTTSQMFDAAYWRAKEGEIARTIVTNSAIRSARVHISTGGRRPFARGGQASASVTVQTGQGGLPASQVRALQFLIAAAVPQLSYKDVAVIDSEGGLLSGGDAARGVQAESSLAAQLRERAERLLIARVGAGNAVVEVSIDTVRQSERISQRTIDPDSRVAISTDVQENSGKSQDNRTSSVSVASNVPAGDGENGAGSAQNENNETRALTNYEISETQRDVVKNAGAVRRLTVAVLVNEAKVTSDTGEVSTSARTADELSALEALVSSAVGLDPKRGDVITLRSMPFDVSPNLGTEVVASASFTEHLNIMQLIQVLVLGAVALILGLFVIRPILSQSGGGALPPLVEQGSVPALAHNPALAGSAETTQSNRIGQMPAGQFAALEGKAVPAEQVDDPVARLRNMISDKEPESLQILQSWMEDESAKGGAA